MELITGDLMITPLGAAIVEALPDRVKVNKVKSQFKKGKCPTSKLFTADEVVKWYKNGEGKDVKAVDNRIKGQ